jgi:hypothetical protein
MSNSAFLAIRQVIVDKMLEAPALAGGNVLAGWRRPISANSAAAVVVLMDGADGREAGIRGGPITWDTEYLVEAHAKDTSDAETAVDPLLRDAFARVQGIDTAALAALGVLQIAVSPLIEWDIRESGQQHVCATLRVRVKHRTSELNLLVPAQTP